MKYYALSIDTAESNSAFSLLSYEDKLVIELHKDFKRPANFKNVGVALQAAWHNKFFSSLIDCYKPNVIIIEGPALNGFHLFSIGMTHAAYLLECVRLKLDFIHMPIATWKYILSGKGNIKPGDYLTLVNNRFNLNLTSRDSAAAIGIGYAGFRFWLWYNGLINTISLSDEESFVFIKRKLPFIKSENVFWHFYNKACL